MCFPVAVGAGSLGEQERKQQVKRKEEKAKAEASGKLEEQEAKGKYPLAVGAGICTESREIATP